MNKKNIVILYGGYSSEHEVSKVSAATIISNMSEEKYNIIPVYITRDGKWLMYDGSIDNIKNIQWERFGQPAIISPDRTHKGLLRLVGEKMRSIPVDAVFPVLHGANGEDGTVQGLLELSGIPYVGCGVLASAIGMDKMYTKIIVKNMGIDQADYLAFHEYELSDLSEVTKQIRYKIGYPCFIKPSNAGSSVGISKATNKKELEEAIRTALKYDRKIIIEKMVVGRELECAVLGTLDTEIKVSVVGEVKPAADFYDYDAKYNNPDSKTIIPANISAETTLKIQQMAIQIFKGIDGRGLSRIDFFYDEANDKIIFNEINTLPGFTSISMYNMLFNESGISTSEIIDTLINTCFDTISTSKD